jgi:surface antigen
MMPETCCPGRQRPKVLRVAGQDVGISGLDHIIEEVMDGPSMSEDRARQVILQKLKALNYVPQSAEDDYVDAIWRELARRASPRKGMPQG